jgi:DNA-binding response OmpR family regulator
MSGASQGNKDFECSLSGRAMNPPEANERPLILLVEEETHERVFIAEHLTNAGFQVLEAEDADAALDLLEGEAEVHGLVTDAHVPGEIDGFELARVGRERWPDMAVVMMSGHSDASSGPLPEGSEFVAKPYLTDRLVPALRTLLRRGT